MIGAEAWGGIAGTAVFVCIIGAAAAGCCGEGIRIIGSAAAGPFGRPIIGDVAMDQPGPVFGRPIIGARAMPPAAPGCCGTGTPLRDAIAA